MDGHFHVRLARSSLWIALCLLPLASHAQAARPETNPQARLHGTFLQLTAAHGSWKPESWRELFGYFKQMGLSQLVVQWTLDEETAFFPTSTYKTVERPPLGSILQQADEAGIEVSVGLAHDPKYWQKIRRERVLVEVYLRRLRFKAEALASELAPSLKKHSSFKGWYIPQEIDDFSWREPELQKILIEYLRALTTRLRQIAPVATVSVSGFSNTASDPKACGEFWNQLLRQAPMDIVFFQDGIGAGNLRLDHLSLYLAAMQQAVAARERQLQVIVEVFNQLDGPPLSEKPFRAVPAPLDRIGQQMELAARYSSSPIIAFAVPEYMTPLGGPAAGRLFQSYLDGQSGR